jgi:DNA-binding transcriptional LysR family regulator
LTFSVAGSATIVDRIDAWTIFAAVAEEGGFAAAARRLGRSPAAVTRAVAALEERLGTRLLNRTTRSVALTGEGALALERCRRVLAEFAELEAPAAAETPRGTLAVTAPIVFGRLHVLPVALGFLRDFPAASLRLLLVDRTVSLVEEGIDVGVRIGELPDSSLRAIRAGALARSVYASPDHLREFGTPETPAELTGRPCIAFTSSPAPDRWVFRDRRAVAIAPRLVVNTAEAAIDAAEAGLGLTRLLSYQAAAPVRQGRLVRVLEEYEPPLLPIHVVHPAGRHLPAKVRLFVDRAVAALREGFG